VSELEDCCGKVVVSCCCEKLVANRYRQFSNPEKEECPLLVAATRRRVKAQQAEKTYICALVNCKVCELVKRL
jgi:hypothetical protein